MIVVDSTTNQAASEVDFDSWPAATRLADYLTRTTLRLHVVEVVRYEEEAA